MDDQVERQEGLRARKRRQTRERIIEAGVRLFVANGFEATTLDTVAAAAEISRRTFFYYFKSKEDILLAWQEGAGDALRAAVLADAPGRAPLEAVRLALSKLIPLFETHNFLVIDGLMRSTETLRARKQGHYEHQEQGLFATLSEIWPDPERRTALRLVAMVSIGAMRLAIEAWIEDTGKRPIVTYLDEAFSALREEI